jgi:hypothetical protein
MEAMVVPGPERAGILGAHQRDKLNGFEELLTGRDRRRARGGHRTEQLPDLINFNKLIASQNAVRGSRHVDIVTGRRRTVYR